MSVSELISEEFLSKKIEVVEATTPIVIVNFEASDASKLYHFAINQAIEEIDEAIELSRKLING